MKIRITIAALFTALLTPLASVSPAAARVDYPAPVIVSPLGGTLSGTVTIAVTSAAPAVKVRIDDGHPYVHLIPMADGAGSWEWDTAGFQSPRITVYPCQAVDVDQCATNNTQVTATVDNPVDSFDAPTSPAFHAPDQQPPMTAVVTDDSSGDLWISFHETVAGQRVGHVTRGVPTPLSFPDSLITATGPLRVIRCSTLDPSFCATASADSANITVRRGLRVRAYISVNGVFSPNGDGVVDTLPVEVGSESGLADLTATWTMTKLDGTPVLPTPVPITLSTESAFSFFDLDPFGQGVSLPTDEYLVQVDETGTDHGLQFAGRATYRVYANSTAPDLTAATPDLAVFNPHPDYWDRSYRDEVTFTITSSGPQPAHLSAVIVDDTGAVVHTHESSSWWDGHRVIWDGRHAGRAVVPEGDYRLVVTAQDSAGNRTVVTSDQVTLSHDAYVPKTWKKTVTDRSSLYANWSGKCGLLRKPGLKGGKGSLGYYSEGRCRTKNVAKGVAAAGHRVILPPADKYEKVTFRVYGGPAHRRNRAGFFTISNQDTMLGHLRELSSFWGWHPNVIRNADDMMWGNRAVYWVVNCAYGQRYDVSKVEVSLDYVVWTGEPGTAPYSSARSRARPSSLSAPTPRMVATVR